MAKRLVMTFTTAGGTKSSLAIDDPKAGLTGSEVRAVMDSIISKNIFNNKNGDFAGVKAAEVITTTTETLI